MLKKIGIDNFIIALGLAVLLAKIFPQGGLDYPGFSLEEITGAGVVLIFFFYGLKLNFQEIKTGLSNWKLHLLVHITTFIIFPLIVLSAKWAFTDSNYYMLWLGAFYVAALPSTVSSSVVMVNIAGGNVPAAIFNASISSFLGIFITPLWMQLVLSRSSEGMDMSDTLLKLVLQVLVPVLAGIALNKYWGKWASRNKNGLKIFDQSIIVAIVYTSFSKSFDQNLFSSQTPLTILLLSVAMVLLFAVVYILVRYICKMLKFNTPDTITTLFCGSKKSLVHGSVLAAVMFGNSTMAGLLLLPVMLYHAFQLIICSILANKISATHSV